MRDVKVAANPWSWSARVESASSDVRSALRSASEDLGSDGSVLAPPVVALAVLDAVGGAADRLAAATGSLGGRVVVRAGGTPDGVSVEVRSAGLGFGSSVVESVSLVGVPAGRLALVVRSAADGRRCSDDLVAAAELVRDALSVSASAWDVSLDVSSSSASLSLRAHRPAQGVAA